MSYKSKYERIASYAVILKIAGLEVFNQQYGFAMKQKLKIKYVYFEILRDTRNDQNFP